MYYYVVNPTAGRGKIKALQNRLRNRLDELGIRGEWVKTTAAGEATKMARTAVASGHTTIVAVGGDDTVNEVINGIDNNNVAVGIIPLGSHNRLANQLGILNWQQACETLAARRLTSYSLIAAGQKFFLSTLSLGFETDLDKTIDTDADNLRDRAKQFAQSLGHARNYNSLAARIDVDGAYTLECSLFTLSISNQKFLNPLASNNLIVSISDRPQQNIKLGRLVWHTIGNRLNEVLDETATTRFLASRVVIETKPVTSIMVDGKIGGRTPIAIRLTDRHIRFITAKVGSDFRDAS